MSALLALLVRWIGLPGLIALGMLFFYEGVPLIRDIPFIGKIPLIGEIATGRVASESRRAVDAALVGYVAESRATAAEAELAEVKRQLDAGKIVIASYTEVAKNARKKELETSAQAETRIKDYEAKLVSLGRSCSLDDSDINELLHN